MATNKTASSAPAKKVPAKKAPLKVSAAKAATPNKLGHLFEMHFEAEGGQDVTRQVYLTSLMLSLGWRESIELFAEVFPHIDLDVTDTTIQ